MKFYSNKWMLGIIPCIIVIFSWFMKKAAGPLWLGMNLDPSYIYLLDSFRILDGNVPTIYGHPGTTVQLFGAIVIKALNLLSNNEVIFLDLIQQPEVYLSTMNSLLILFYGGTLAWLGFYAYKKSNHIVFSLFVQSSSLQYLTLKSFIQSKEVLPVVANFNPETFLLLVTNLFLLCVLKLFFEYPSRKFSTAFFFGIVCALGVVTKITFVPMLLFPILLLPGWKRKAQFLFFLILFFFILTVPIYSQFLQMLEWFTSISTHTGTYGSGKAGFFDLNKMCLNAGKLIQWNIVFFSVLFFSFVSVLYFYLLKKKDIVSDEKKKLILFLFVTILTALAQASIVFKHLGPHYLLPGLCLLGVVTGWLFLLYTPGRISKAIVLVGITMGVVQIAYSYQYQVRLKERNSSLLAFSERIYEQNKDNLIIPYYRASSKEYALFFGYRQDFDYGKKIEKIYPHAVFHHEGSNRFYNFSGQLSFEDIKKRSPNIYLHGSTNHFGAYFKVEKIDSIEKTENLHKVFTVASDQAIALFYMSQKLASEGHFKESILLALKAKSLGYPNLEGYLLSLKKQLDR